MWIETRGKGVEGPEQVWEKAKSSNTAEEEAAVETFLVEEK